VSNPGHPCEDNPYIIDGTLTFTLLVIFLLHHDKLLTEIEPFSLYMHAVENLPGCVNCYRENGLDYGKCVATNFEWCFFAFYIAFFKMLYS